MVLEIKTEFFLYPWIINQCNDKQGKYFSFYFFSAIGISCTYSEGCGERRVYGDRSEERRHEIWPTAEEI